VLASFSYFAATTGKTKSIKLNVNSLYKQFTSLDIMAKANGFNDLESYAKSMNFETVDAMIEIYSQSCKQITDNDTNQESVNTYGGFYIARYEAGDGDANGTRRSSSSSNSNTVVSKKGAIVYNYISQPDSITRAESMYAGKSKLISGAGWDRILNWLIETKAKTENEVFVNSSSWGNYNDSTGNAKTNSGYGNLNYRTGRNEAWKANNIYDLAGNVEDWTTEASSSGRQVGRGGSYPGSGSDNPASERYTGYPYGSDSDIGFRPALYL